MHPILPGATPHDDGTTFCVWAPERNSVAVEIDGATPVALEKGVDGFFSRHIEGVKPGARYGFRIDGGAVRPDLCSRWQPDGSDGLSVVMPPDGFEWTDTEWQGVHQVDQVIYEMHVGTFTPEGTWRAATDKLKSLRELGVTVIQLMPIGTFKGRFGWGYDTILPYAPFAPYGTPDELKAFIDAAHGEGIGVIHDVVYNHVGMGDHYHAYCAHYFTDRYDNEWGAGFNFDGAQSRPVRDFIVGNARYWIEQFHMDGLRLDATQALFDDGDDHIIAEITRAVRAAAPGRTTYVIAENHTQDRKLIEQPDAGYGLDALVSDDFQHAARVAITGRNDFYYRDYLGKPQELVSALKYGFLYQGQRSDMRDGLYGTYNLDTAPQQIVHFLENHDQIANSARGFRLSTLASAARLRALTPLLLLGPQTPCLFQGQEYAAANPFFYFLGVEGDDAKAVTDGRRQSLTNFISVSDPLMQARLPDPTADDTFARSKLDWSAAGKSAAMFALHRDLLALRRIDKAFSQATERRVDGAVIGDAALLIRYLTPDPADHRLLLVNFGRDLQMGVVAEPLLAPPAGHRWDLHWSSEHPDYDGGGRVPFDFAKFVILPSDTAIVLAAKALS